MESALGFVISKMNYLTYVLLMVVGFYGIAVKQHYMKKIIGLNILQTAIILFFISVGFKQGATLPILVDSGNHPVTAGAYINPLPHVLMLTAIVVAVATLGVALALAIRIYRAFGTLNEAAVLSAMAEEAKEDPPLGGDPQGKGETHG